MATPRELVLAVSQQTGVPVNTVIQHDRNLSLSGMRTVAGRGRAAAQVTFLDAANLLIAVAASRNVKDSAETARIYGALESSSPLVLEEDGGDRVWGRAFQTALADLLESVPLHRERFGGANGDTITVSLFGPEPRAKIDIYQNGRERPLTAKYEDKRSNRAEPSSSFHDLTFVARFSQITLGLVGEVVAADPKR